MQGPKKSVSYDTATRSYDTLFYDHNQSIPKIASNSKKLWKYMRYASDQEAFKSLNKALKLIGWLRTQGLLITNHPSPRDKKIGHFKLTSGNSNSQGIFASLFKETPRSKGIIWIMPSQKAFLYSENKVGSSSVLSNQYTGEARSI